MLYLAKFTAGKEWGQTFIPVPEKAAGGANEELQ